MGRGDVGGGASGGGGGKKKKEGGGVGGVAWGREMGGGVMASEVGREARWRGGRGGRGECGNGSGVVAGRMATRPAWTGGRGAGEGARHGKTRRGRAGGPAVGGNVRTRADGGRPAGADPWGMPSGPRRPRCQVRPRESRCGTVPPLPPPPFPPLCPAPLVAGGWARRQRRAADVQPAPLSVSDGVGCRLRGL